ncbi:MAG: hypothetical protein KKA73_23050 [Chloroflexi bacterium]|nr:hypothetical protein [Chloroflexota bacterium]MBU1750569.1 hypothetical protein [Chloroflexota bacterium]
MTTRWTVFLLLALLLLVAGCAPVPDAPESAAAPRAAAPQETTMLEPTSPPATAPRLISVEELRTMLQNKDFALINVHIPYEGEIPGTDANIPYNELEKYVDQLPQDKDARIVVYCRSGSMSATASQTLTQMGYTNVMDVQGGMVAWQAAGYGLLPDSQASVVNPPTATRSAAVAAVQPTNTPSATSVVTAVTTDTVGDVQLVTPAEAKALLDSGAALLYDTRSAEAYQTQHAAGALSFPDATMVERYPDLPTDKALIFYCT